MRLPHPAWLPGKSIISTILDLQEGSRVLDVYRPASAFLLGTNYEKHFIIRDFTAIGGINIDRENPPTNGIMSFKFRVPLSIEPWDIFEFDVLGTTKNGGIFIIQIRPVQPSYGSCKIFDGTSTESMNPFLATVIQEGDLTTDTPMIIRLDIGPNFLDGSWHIF